MFLVGGVPSDYFTEKKKNAHKRWRNTVLEHGLTITSFTAVQTNLTELPYAYVYNWYIGMYFTSMSRVLTPGIGASLSDVHSLLTSLDGHEHNCLCANF